MPQTLAKEVADVLSAVRASTKEVNIFLADTERFIHEYPPLRFVWLKLSPPRKFEPMYEAIGGGYTLVTSPDPEKIRALAERVQARVRAKRKPFYVVQG